MKLSVCIATLNRANFIGATLDSIVADAPENFEIIVVDGASTDNTQGVIARYQAAYPFIRYERLAEKGGIDRDFTRAAEIARGEYLWFFSDDDILMPGAMAAVLDYLSPKLDLIVVNSEVRSADMSKVLKRAALDIDSDIIYESSEAEALFEDVASYMSFIGCIVIKKASWDERDKESYFGSWFVHMGVIFQKPLRNSTLVISKPWISIRYGNATWSSKSFEISLFKWPTLVWSFANFKNSVMQKITPREPWASPKTLLIYRARGAYSMQDYVDHLKPRLPLGIRRMVAKSIAITPKFMLNTFMKLYFSITRKFHANAELQLVDLGG